MIQMTYEHDQSDEGWNVWTLIVNGYEYVFFSGNITCQDFDEDITFVFGRESERFWNTLMEDWGIKPEEECNGYSKKSIGRCLLYQKDSFSNEEAYQVLSLVEDLKEASKFYIIKGI